MEIIIKVDGTEAKFTTTEDDDIYTTMGQFILAALIAGYYPESIMNACKEVLKYGPEKIINFYLKYNS